MFVTRLNAMATNINLFYSTFTDEENHHEFDIESLGENRYRGMEIMFTDGNGNVRGGESFNSPTTQEDYDDAFFETILRLSPIYKIPDFLDHHFDFFKMNNNNTDLFLKHIRYVILPMLKRASRSEYVELTLNWINKQNTMLLQQQLKEKNEFLKKAYEAAYEYHPSSPLSVSLNPREFGVSIGFDESTVKRIMNELVQDGYVTSGLGMRMMLITNEGLNYLHSLEQSQTTFPVTPAINVTVGDNSNFQFQNGTVHSQQTIEVKNNDIEDFKKFLKEIKNNLSELKPHLSTEEFEILEAETNYMENNLQRSNPNKSKLTMLKDNILEILKAVPANVIANLISGGITF